MSNKVLYRPHSIFDLYLYQICKKKFVIKSRLKHTKKIISRPPKVLKDNNTLVFKTFPASIRGAA